MGNELCCIPIVSPFYLKYSTVLLTYVHTWIYEHFSLSQLKIPFPNLWKKICWLKMSRCNWKKMTNILFDRNFISKWNDTFLNILQLQIQHKLQTLVSHGTFLCHYLYPAAQKEYSYHQLHLSSYTNKYFDLLRFIITTRLLIILTLLFFTCTKKITNIILSYFSLLQYVIIARS